MTVLKMLLKVELKAELKAAVCGLACMAGLGMAHVSFAAEPPKAPAPPPQSVGLEVITTGKGYGSVSSSPSGISCYVPRPNVNYLIAPDCSEVYATPQSITLTARTDSDSTFMGWEGACSGLAKICTVTVSPLALTTVRARYMGTLDLGDCLFDWLETNFPAHVAPRGTRTVSAATYHFRYYPATDSYLGLSTADGHVYFLPAHGQLLDLGDASGAGLAAACK
ncbi:MAG: hypothetical protein CFE43_08975 [Burkholderiales bacterium PBB3]|nr:MAG: hypothetical protein CFE43_08975 [Burkholderiales bacterium PBB3]